MKPRPQEPQNFHWKETVSEINNCAVGWPVLDGELKQRQVGWLGEGLGPCWPVWVGSESTGRQSSVGVR